MGRCGALTLATPGSTSQCEALAPSARLAHLALRGNSVEERRKLCMFIMDMFSLQDVLPKFCHNGLGKMNLRLNLAMTYFMKPEGGGKGGGPCLLYVAAWVR